MDFYEAYHYLDHHPMFHGRFLPELWLSVFRSEDGKGVQILLEHGPRVTDAVYGEMFSHDIRLDTWAPTFEEAIIGLAKRVREFYPDCE